MAWIKLSDPTRLYIIVHGNALFSDLTDLCLALHVSPQQGCINATTEIC